MEEMRKAAMAYYANMSSDNQQLVVSLFRSMDVNGDEKVSIEEYLNFLKTEKGCQKEVPQNMFKLLDANNDGTLSFEECITFYYLITCKRLLLCKGCGTYLLGLRFVCVECYRVDKEKSYDLCSSCYESKSFSHPHSSFLDNDVLLQQYHRKRDKLKRRTKKVLKYSGQFAWGFFSGYTGN